MDDLQKLQAELAAATKAGKEQIQGDNAEHGTDPGSLSPAATEAGEKIAGDISPIQRQMANALNRNQQDKEYSRYPDTQYYLSKSFWSHGGSVKDILYTPTNDPYIKDLQSVNDEVVMLGMMKASGPMKGVAARGENDNPNPAYIQELKGLRHWHRLQEMMAPIIDSAKASGADVQKALATGNTGTGEEWIPTEYSADLIDEVRLNTMVANLFRVIPMSVGSTLKLPTSTSRPVAYIADQADTDEPGSLLSSDLGTGQITLTPVTFAVRVNLSYEFIEDSIIPALPLVREKIVLGLADGLENATLNGDTASAHQDTGLAAYFAANPADVRKAAWDGLRKLTVSGAQIDFNSGTEAFTTANHRAIRKAMGRYGMRPDELSWITSINGYIRMLSLTEVITMDVYGSRATILSGQLASFDGSPVIVSEYVRNDLNASGVYDATTVTKTQTLCVHRPSFLYGEKRGVTVEMESRPSQQRHIMVATMRRDFKSARPSTDAPVGYGYDFAN